MTTNRLASLRAALQPYPPRVRAAAMEPVTRFIEAKTHVAMLLSAANVRRRALAKAGGMSLHHLSEHLTGQASDPDLQVAIFTAFVGLARGTGFCDANHIGMVEFWGDLLNERIPA